MAACNLSKPMDEELSSMIRQKNVLVIDDVTTSGSKLNEILRTLRILNEDNDITIFSLIGSKDLLRSPYVRNNSKNLNSIGKWDEQGVCKLVPRTEYEKTRYYCPLLGRYCKGDGREKQGLQCMLCIDILGGIQKTWRV